MRDAGGTAEAKRHPFRTRAVAALLASSVALAGCTVGPSFRRPEAPPATTYTEAPLPDETASARVLGGKAQRFVPGGQIPRQWWSLFHSEALDGMIRLALSESPTLASAAARLRQAQEYRAAQIGLLFPAVDANVSATRQRISGASQGQPGMNIEPFNLVTSSLSASYALDLFGGVRRRLEALGAEVDYQRFQLEAAYLTLTFNLVTAAVQEASLRAQIKATQEIIGLQEHQLGVVERQFEIGGVSRSDVLAQRAQLAQTLASLPPLQKILAQTRHQMAALMGRLPGDVAELPGFELGELDLPRELPVSLPSALVRQRPDIRAAEALLHAASARVGVATANLYPQITLAGSFGAQTSKPADLFGSGTTIWGFGAGLLQPVFHGGALTAQRRAAIAAHDQAAADYQGVVLAAFRGVADVLRAIDDDARLLNAQAEAEAVAADALDLAEQQFQMGAINYLLLLNAERQYQQSAIALVQAQALRFADTAALFYALGGPWLQGPAQGDAPGEAKKE